MKGQERLGAHLVIVHSERRRFFLGNVAIIVRRMGEQGYEAVSCPYMPRSGLFDNGGVIDK